MLLEYAEAFLRAHGPRCAPAAGAAAVGGRDSLPVQRALRPRRRIGAVGNQPQEACAEEPRATGDRGCRRNAGDRAAGLRSGPHCQLTEEARGLTVSSAGVRCVWLRHDLERLKASEAKSARTARSDRGAGHRAGKKPRRRRGTWRVRERASRLMPPPNSSCSAASSQ